MSDRDLSDSSDKDNGAAARERAAAARECGARAERILQRQLDAMKKRDGQSSPRPEKAKSESVPAVEPIWNRVPTLDRAQGWWRNPCWEINRMLRGEVERMHFLGALKNQVSNGEADAIAQLFGLTLAEVRNELTRANSLGAVPISQHSSLAQSRSCFSRFISLLQHRIPIERRRYELDSL